jgi:hypothetical protein
MPFLQNKVFQEAAGFELFEHKQKGCRSIATAIFWFATPKGMPEQSDGHPWKYKGHQKAAFTK